jgi:4a-hydroxytetrahydrobiopterin dehydratase
VGRRAVELLSEGDIARELAKVPDWIREDDRIVTSVQAETFLLALDLVMAVGQLAEAADHHPDIDIRWRTLSFRLSTHSAGGLTEKDFALAREIDGLLA